MIWAIDPGTTHSAYVTLRGDGEMNPQTGLGFDILPNGEMRDKLCGWVRDGDEVVIEMVASYGMPVGAEVFETVYWIGRFAEVAEERGARVTRLPRLAVKMHVCHDGRAKDANVRRALMDRFGDVGTKKEPGWFYGFRRDVWAAYGLAVTFVEGGRGYDP